MEVCAQAEEVLAQREAEPVDIWRTTFSAQGTGHSGLAGGLWP